ALRHRSAGRAGGRRRHPPRSVCPVTPCSPYARSHVEALTLVTGPPYADFEGSRPRRREHPTAVVRLTALQLSVTGRGPQIFRNKSAHSRAAGAARGKETYAFRTIGVPDARARDSRSAGGHGGAGRSAGPDRKLYRSWHRDPSSGRLASRNSNGDRYRDRPGG